MSHFEGKFEVELKFKIESKEAVLSRLVSINAEEHIIGNTETDYFFDYPNNQLANDKKTHVLRKMNPSGKILWFIKGPEKDRCECLDLNNLPKAISMLENLGFIIKNKLTKQRDMYFKDKFHITIDSIDGVGVFSEVAVMTDDESQLVALRSEVAKFAESIGIDPAAVEERSYKDICFNL